MPTQKRSYGNRTSTFGMLLDRIGCKTVQYSIWTGKTTNTLYRRCRGEIGTPDEIIGLLRWIAELYEKIDELEGDHRDSP